MHKKSLKEILISPNISYLLKKIWLLNNNNNNNSNNSSKISLNNSNNNNKNKIQRLKPTLRNKNQTKLLSFKHLMILLKIQCLMHNNKNNNSNNHNNSNNNNSNNKTNNRLNNNNQNNKQIYLEAHQKLPNHKCHNKTLTLYKQISHLHLKH